MKTILFIASLVLLAFTLLAFTYPRIPDRTKTPGDFCSKSNPDFKEYRYEEKVPICDRNVTSNRKTKIYDSYGVPKEDREDYTIDHLIPLAIGGSNSDKNLWPQNKEILSASYEYKIYKQLKEGEITQEEAVDLIMKYKFKQDSTDVNE